VRHAGFKVYKHVGIYAYRREFLLDFARLEPTTLEMAESLEQLRALENGYRIKVLKTDFKFIGVNTEEDLIRVNRIFKGEK
jgi:3-deoxy-manno-octulosonate cytidylyltransferase (CMP-KDO synthetase)